MRMKTVLIAAESSYLREALAEDLAQQYRILTCADGKRALDAICDHQPDIMVIDLALQKMEGIAVLREAAIAGVQPATVVLAGVVNDSVVRALEDLKVCHIFCKPYSYDYIVACLLELEHRPCTGQSYAQLLAQLGFKMNTESTRILLTALGCYMENPEQKITRELYPQVAQLCGGTPLQVEKAIRSAIDAAWKKNNRQWLKFFPTDNRGRVIRPTNGAFLSRITMQTDKSNTQMKAVEAV